jgi:hypothetical protein
MAKQHDSNQSDTHVMHACQHMHAGHAALPTQRIDLKVHLPVECQQAWGDSGGWGVAAAAAKPNAPSRLGYLSVESRLSAISALGSSMSSN